MNTDGELLRVGIVGCGRVTEDLHLPSLQLLKDIKVVALSELEEGRLNCVADRFGVEQRYVRYEDLVNDPLVQIVAVCVPGASHADVALAALDAGKHVFVEKPLALSLDDADRMIERAAKTSLCCTVGFNLRSHRLVQEARRIIRSGVLGSMVPTR